MAIKDESIMKLVVKYCFVRALALRLKSCPLKYNTKRCKQFYMTIESSVIVGDI